MQLCFKWKSYKGPSEKTPTEIGLVSKSSTTRLPSNSAGNAWAPLAWFSLHYAAWKCARAGSGRFLCTTCSVCILGLLLKTCPLTTSPLATQLLDVNSLEWPGKKQGGRLSCEVKSSPSPHPHYSYFRFVFLYSSFFLFLWFHFAFSWREKITLPWRKSSTLLCRLI